MPTKTLALPLLLFATLARADVYTLGSSYTWDGFPEDLEPPVEWHIDCGRSLIYIYDHPSHPCVPSSSLWPTALASESFRAISFQPVPEAGSTLWTDIFTIYTWTRDQPTADIVIHQTWPLPGQWESVYHGLSQPGVTNRSLVYGYELKVWLNAVRPERRVVMSRGNEMLDHIYHDCEQGECPLAIGFNQMFRDSAGHMSSYGRYLQHNALRGAFGQTIGVQPPDGESISPIVRAYLDDVVVQYVPEPREDALLLAGLSLLMLLSRARRGLPLRAGRVVPDLRSQPGRARPPAAISPARDTSASSMRCQLARAEIERLTGQTFARARR